MAEQQAPSDVAASGGNVGSAGHAQQRHAYGVAIEVPCGAQLAATADRAGGNCAYVYALRRATGRLHFLVDLGFDYPSGLAFFDCPECGGKRYPGRPRGKRKTATD